MVKTALLAITLGVALAWGSAANADPAKSPPPKTVVFNFSFDNTSMEPTRPDEVARVKLVSNLLRTELQKSGEYDVIDPMGVPFVQKKLDSIVDIRQCNGCERPLAEKLGGKLVVYGWIQKVSNLILNLNIVIENADTGVNLHNGSVDIRDNIDESWTRGLKFLLDEHVFSNRP